ncbi:MAG: lipoyl synthase [Desulfobacterales bacterium]
MKGHPVWLKRPAPSAASLSRMESMLSRLKLATVCQSAQCPNIGECFHRGTATFMILGDRCTRNCRFCAVPHTTAPLMPDDKEPMHVAQAVKAAGLSHVVITSVTRDDLPDGGAGHFVSTVEAVRKRSPESTVELLIPDFKGEQSSVEAICRVWPDVFNHNVETVPRLYREIRPQADYARSLTVLSQAAEAGLRTKSGLMLGLGETASELENVFQDLVASGCRILTMGQYLAPSRDHAPVRRYIPPEEFDMLASVARKTGFEHVFAGPFVRSSYRAEELLSK